MEQDYAEAWEEVQAAPEAVRDPKVLAHAAGFEAVRAWRAERRGGNEDRPIDRESDLAELTETANEYIDTISEEAEHLSPLDEGKAREIAERWLVDFLDEEEDKQDN